MITNLRVANAKITLKLSALLLFVCLLIIPEPSQAQFTTAENILNGGTLGGTRGMRLRRIGGSTSYSTNPDFVYYPASSMKIIEHLYSMVLVEATTWNLNTGVTVITNGINCGSALNSSIASGNPQVQPLSTVLTNMMVPSSNQATNAIQERIGLTSFPNILPFSANMAFWGRVVLNSFVQNTLNMSNSGVNHKLGCGGPCTFNPANALTLRDIERLYRAIATNVNVISPAGRVQLKDLMLNESNSFLNTMISQEAASTGKQAYVNDFRNQLYMIWKDGGYSCNGRDFRVSSGLLQLPTHGGTYKRLYTWGIFADEGQSWAYLPGTVRAATVELLRSSVRSALLTWGNNYLPAEKVDGIIKKVKKSPMLSSRGRDAILARSSLLALDSVSTTLHAASKNYVLAVRNLQTAVQNWDEARQLNITLPEDSIIFWITDAAQHVTLDATAMLASIIDDSTKPKKPVDAEEEMNSGDRLFAVNDYKGALHYYLRSVSISNPYLDWNFRGERSQDASVGFVPSTAAKSSSLPQALPAELNVQVGPNPSQGLIHIYLADLNPGSLNITVLDLSGKIVGRVFDGDINSADERQWDFDGSQLASGVYLLRVQNGTSHKTQKIMIQD